MIAGIIPARFASSRFPGKPLVEIEGKSMIQRVYEQASRAPSLHTVVVATDDDRIREHVESFGGRALMTAEHHPSGTDRCYEALQQLGADYRFVINIQGDEPFIDPAQIEEIAAALSDDSVEIATQIIPVTSEELLFDTGEVKVVLNARGEGMYFSRSPIPFIKGLPQAQWHAAHTFYRHAGLYAYRADILAALTRLPVSSLEKGESLEQLRWLEAGYRIRCVETAFESHCVDTPEDIERALRMIRASNS